jgi:predicted negative regulator of RcsB-dependent stress response
MPLDLEEQEQLENLKSFWVNYGRWLAIGILIAIIGYGAYWFYNKNQTSVALDASQQYEELVAAATKSDFPLVLKKAQNLEQNFSNTTYSAMAGLVAANLAYSIGDFEQASSQLKWVEEKAKSESFQSLARLRLVALLIDQKDESSIAKANELLKKKIAPGYEALQHERQGDLWLVQNKNEEAKKEYLQAWEILDLQKAKQSGLKELDSMTKEMEKRNPGENQRLLKVKIDSLGGF